MELVVGFPDASSFVVPATGAVVGVEGNVGGAILVQSQRRGLSIPDAIITLFVVASSSSAKSRSRSFSANEHCQ